MNNPIIVPDIRYYENIDWRDPYIFYNEEEMEYWMLIAARKNSGPSNRRGVVVLYKSKDLQEFEHWGVIYEPWPVSYTHLLRRMSIVYFIIQ